MSTPDFFRSRLDAMIDLRHPLAVLAMRMPWPQIEATLAPVFARQARDGQLEVGEDLFGPTLAVAGAGISAAGRPRLPIRLMVALLYLKHAYNESDESVCERWAQDVYYQYFSGQEYFEPRLPCDPTNLVRFRQALGEAGVEELLATTIAAAVQMGAIKPAEFECVIVDTTVQEKAIAYPTDSRLLDVARAKLVRLAKRAGLNLKQTFEREGKKLRRSAGGYAHAKQFKRLRRVLKRQRTILGRILRDIERKLSGTSDAMQATMQPWIERAWRICRQRPKDKNKLYALHAPEVECISKGKARQPYEFGVKVSLAVTASQGLIVGARSFPGNPYDGHTLHAQLEQTTILLQELPGAPKPNTAIVDLGYRGVDAEVAPVKIVHRGRIKTMNQVQRRMLKRRQAVEPVIGHVKADHGLRRNWLKGEAGDALHPILCAAGFNLRWLLRAIVRLGLSAVFFVFLLLRLLGRTVVPVGQLALPKLRD
ncbi:IS5 family transposase [Cupriavidus basilensis]|uniref:IS5 family transposase n=1 Tax=Cupriavidus basilensis TaxID=68895 RepID=A0A643FHL9_9BURK|nr:IS5 family transposase [Cupriavidus basilensis]QOT75777.1 IS5 family transposase [Cupriavidus basilensis]QOT76340.1 IS5 family transposase [Cupriavidus basilensis]QOT76534.1 IS5 family transposase [Cupriavidus basilensis]